MILIALVMFFQVKQNVFENAKSSGFWDTLFLRVNEFFIQILIQHFKRWLPSCVRISSLFPSNHLRNNPSKNVTVGWAGLDRFITNIEYTVRIKNLLVYNLCLKNQWLPRYRVGWDPHDIGKKFSSAYSLHVNRPCTLFIR